jgi:hypothetical protein
MRREIGTFLIFFACRGLRLGPPAAASQKGEGLGEIILFASPRPVPIGHR